MNKAEETLPYFFVVLDILIMNVNLPGNFVRKMVQKVQPSNRIMFVKWC